MNRQGPRTRTVRRACLGWVRVGGLASAGLLPSLALSASILVNTTDDEFNTDGDCSLREAVLSANSNSFFDNCNAGTTGEDSITLLVTGSIQLNDELEVSEGLNIVGPGRDALTLDAGQSSRHFTVDMPDNTHDFSLSGVTLTEGLAGAGGGGAILAIQVGTLAVDNVRLTDNRAETTDDLHGGALALILPADNGSRLEIHDSILEDNVASGDGGAVHADFSGVAEIDIQRSAFRRNTSGDNGGAVNGGAVTFVVADSVFEDNSTALTVPSADDFGGAAFWFDSATNALLLIERTTFSGNSSQAGGGALFSRGTNTVVRNSTFSGNQSIDDPGAAIDFIGTQASVLFTTLLNNGDGNGSDVAIRVRELAEVTLTHSIVWSDWSPDADCEVDNISQLNSGGFNIDSSGTCTSHPTDRPDTDPRLGPLADNGDDVAGVVLRTHLPKSGSVAIDGGGNSCPGLFGGNTVQDQRGRARPVPAAGASSAFCDIGAVELQPADQPTLFADRFENVP